MIKGDGDPLAEAFADAGLGMMSCREAARLVRSTGMSFETAAVLGQRFGEKSEATSERIREAASVYRGQRDAARPRSVWKRQSEAPSKRLQERDVPRSPWGRPLQEG